MLGDVYKDNDDKLWVEIELDGTPYLEDSYDLSYEYNLPEMMLLDSGDSEFISLNSDGSKDFISSLTKIDSEFELFEVLNNFGSPRYTYCNTKKLKDYLFEEFKSIDDVKQMIRFFRKYQNLFYDLI